MKTKLGTLTCTAALMAGGTSLHAQTAPLTPYGQPTVLTHEQAQAQSKTQMTQAQIQYIGILERGFDQLSNIVTANPYHLSQTDVVAGFGDAFNTQVQQEGALLLATVIKANKIIGRTDKWLAQDWVVAWIAAYKLDPTTGEPLPTP